VIELFFHNELYDGFAVDEATKLFADYASFELEREGSGYVVRLSPLPSAIEAGFDEETIAAELANYALGKTIEKGSMQ